MAFSIRISRVSGSTRASGSGSEANKQGGSNDEYGGPGTGDLKLSRQRACHGHSPLAQSPPLGSQVPL